jgi:hypothetical protein
MSPVTISQSRRELAQRVSGGIEVTLYWCAEDDNTSIELRQPASEERLAFVVPREDALEAFYHPFVHIPLSLGEQAPAFDARVRS